MKSPLKSLTVADYLNERARAYAAALHGHCDVVVLAAHSYIDFAQRECKIEYYRTEWYREFIEDNHDVLADVAKTIDADINLYWRAALTELMENHTFLCGEYGKRIGGRSAKAKISLLSKPNKAQLGMIKKDIQAALRKLPNEVFSDSSHVARWRGLANICAPVIRDAYDKHSELVRVIEDADKARYERIRNQVGILSGLVSHAVSLARLYLAGMPA